MIARVAIIAAFFAALPLLALGGGVDSCNTGDIQCCNSFEDSNSAAGSALLATLPINVQNVVGQIGLQCSPVTVIGGQITSTCSQRPVCCQNNNVGGLVSVGCIPIQL